MPPRTILSLVASLALLGALATGCGSPADPTGRGVTAADGAGTAAGAGHPPSGRRERMIATEDFEHPPSKLLSDDPSAERLWGHANGAYYIKTRPSRYHFASGTFIKSADAANALGFDVWMEGDTADRLFTLSCASLYARGANYSFVLSPSDGAFKLRRSEDGESSTLTESAGPHPAIKRGNEVNRIEMLCAGKLVTVTANGDLLASVETDVPDGELFFPVCAQYMGEEEGQAQVWLDNLTVLKR